MILKVSLAYYRAGRFYDYNSFFNAVIPGYPITSAIHDVLAKKLENAIQSSNSGKSFTKSNYCNQNEKHCFLKYPESRIT